MNRSELLDAISYSNKPTSLSSVVSFDQPTGSPLAEPPLSMCKPLKYIHLRLPEIRLTDCPKVQLTSGILRC